jgi:hypothetical protein
MGRSKSALSAIRLAYAYMFQMDITRGFEDDMVKSATGKGSFHNALPWLKVEARTDNLRIVSYDYSNYQEY